MQNKDASAALKEKISILEKRQFEERILLKEQLFFVYERSKPFNIIKNTFEDLTSSLTLKNSLINNIFGALTGYLTQKVFVGSKPGLFKKIAGMILKYGVTAVVSKYSETLKTMGVQLLREFLSHKHNEARESASNAH
jgi:hypothetical protein